MKNIEHWRSFLHTATGLGCASLLLLGCGEDAGSNPDAGRDASVSERDAAPRVPDADVPETDGGVIIGRDAGPEIDGGSPSDGGTGGTFAPPDLVTMTFDAPGDLTVLRANGGSIPSPTHDIDPAGGRGGSAALRVRVEGGDVYNPVGVRYGERARVFVRWYFRTEGTPNGNVKGVRFHDDVVGNQGELYLGGMPCWAFDFEASAACVTTGMYYGEQIFEDARAGLPINASNLADGSWHSFEVEYDRNAGAFVEARVWVDGRAVVMPAGDAIHYGFPYPAMQWVGGDRATNTPTTYRATRASSPNTSWFGIVETISSAEGSAIVWYDDFAVSTTRIGP